MKEFEVSMARNRNPCCEAAFNRLELVVVMATLVLLAGLALPTLGNTKTRSQRITCVANLRQIGHALHVWGNDHGDKTPSRTDYREGGLYLSPNPLRNLAYFQFSVISNELVTPKTLVCPADLNVGFSRRVASNWSTFDNVAGYMALGLRDRSTSYTVALDAFFDQPRSILSSDRNLRTSGVNTSCSSGVGSANFFVLDPPSPGVGWTNAIHFQSGNTLFYDGQVEQLSVPGFSNALNGPYFNGLNFGSDNAVLHFLTPN